MSTMIVDAQLLLNTHRTCHGLIEHYYGAVKNVLDTLGKRLEGQPSMVHTFHQTMDQYLREGVSINQQAALRLEYCFQDFLKSQGSKKRRKHLEFVEHRLGSSLPLSDYCTLLKDQSTAYKALTENVSMMKYYLYMVLMDCFAKENPETAKYIHQCIEGLTEPLIIIEGVCEFKNTGELHPQ